MRGPPRIAREPEPSSGLRAPSPACGRRCLVSIVTPTYNAAGKIGATLDSVLAQDPSLFEYLVIDGGSRDRTQEIVRRAPGVTLISEPDDGIYDASNKGIAHSSGRFLYFLGAGDLLRPGILARIAERLENSPPNSILYGDVYWVNRKRIYDGPFSKRDLTTHGICHQAMFFDRSVFELLGMYEQRYVIAADWHLNIRAAADPRIHMQYIGEVIADYEGGGFSDTGYDARFQEDLPQLIRTTFGAPYLLLLQLHRIRRRIYGISLRLRDLLRPSAGR